MSLDQDEGLQTQDPLDIGDDADGTDSDDEVISLSDDEVQDGELDELDKLLGINEDDDQDEHAFPGDDATLFYDAETMRAAEPENLPPTTRDLDFGEKTPSKKDKQQIVEVSDSPFKRRRSRSLIVQRSSDRRRQSCAS